MNEQGLAKDMATWCSTYGQITDQRILEIYKIKLDPEDLLQALQTPDSFYNSLLKIPLRNVFNGIILQQTHDYQIYAQKLFIDYLLSGEADKDAAAPGSGVREDLKGRQEILQGMNESFRACELAHERLISKTQLKLMDDAKRWNILLQELSQILTNNLRVANLSVETVKQTLVTFLTAYDFKRNFSEKHKVWAKMENLLGFRFDSKIQQLFISEANKLEHFTAETDSSLSAFDPEIQALGREARQFRSDFYKLILETRELLQLLPEYELDEAQDKDNRESLYFDSRLGEESST